MIALPTFAPKPAAAPPRLALARGTRFLLLGLRAAWARLVESALQAAGAAVVCGPGVPRGLRLLRSDQYAVVLVALRGRPQSDAAVLRACRRHGEQAGILALLPSADRAQLAQVINDGADDCLALPFHRDELLARLGALARRVGKRGPAAPTIRLHDLEIDTLERTVRRRGQAIHLTPREYALLQLLARHHGRVVTRSMIWQQLYATQEEQSSNVIDVYIRYLRAKIDRDHELPLILTRWGEGYLLRAEA